LAAQVNTPVAAPAIGRSRELIQVTAGFGHGDAISDWVRFVARHARDLGFTTRCVSYHFGDGMDDVERLGQHKSISNDALMLYHHSIGSEVTPMVVAHAGPKALNYHNITPAKYFDAYRPNVAQQLRDGRRDLPALAPHFPMSFGVSAYNAKELRECGFQNPFVIPISVEMDRWDYRADQAIMQTFTDGAHNLLFVGRYSPNKCQPHLISIFEEYVKLHPHSRMIIVGGGDINTDPYTQYLYHRAKVSPARERIVLTNHISGEKIQAYFRTATTFVSASEHEGFCVPLIESMWFDVPIVAYASSAIPETLANSGLLFEQKVSPARIAAMIYQVNTNPVVRQKIIASQRERRKAFSADAIKPMLTDMLLRLSGTQPSSQAA
jgi:glycosyltransferase involved in cell wall biosynthesis